MKKNFCKTMLMVAGVSLTLGLSGVASAAPFTDVKEAPVGWFVPTDAQKYEDAVYWRWYDQDWGWQHSAITPGFTTASLLISAFDVDLSSGEVDNIYAYDDGVKTLLGSLDGNDDIWAFTTFTLGSSFFNDIANGLQVEIDIDVNNQQRSWAVTLAKSVVTVDGGFIPDPDPGKVPEPTTMLLFGAGLTGLAAFGRRRETK